MARRLLSIGRAVAIIGATALTACSSVDEADASGLTAGERSALVGRYYSCARQQDVSCVTATLHPDFTAPDEVAAARSRSGHGPMMASRLVSAKVEARILPHKGAEVWVVEVWNDRHGATTSLLRSFSFADGLIRSKTSLTS